MAIAVRTVVSKLVSPLMGPISFKIGSMEVLKMKLVKNLVVGFFVVLVAACGGGGSSSGGSAVPPPSVGKTTYQGTYSAGAYSGNITVVIEGAVPTVTFTGVPCLQAPFSNGLTTSVSGLNRGVSGQIAGQQPDSLGRPASIDLVFPDTQAGPGTITLRPGSNCVPVVGSLSIASIF